MDQVDPEAPMEGLQPVAATLTRPNSHNRPPADLAPEILQVIAVVAEIMLEQRRRRPVEGISVGRMIPNDPAKKESFADPPAATSTTH